MTGLAIVHERFSEFGGSEAVVEAMCTIWPDATVLAPIADPRIVPAGLAGHELRTSPLQRVYRGGPSYAHLLPLIPAAMRRLDLRGFDTVVLSHHAFATRTRPDAGARVVAYVYSPARWMWDPRMRSDEVGGRIGRLALGAFSAGQRRADLAASRRPDLLVACSRGVAERVGAWWGRESQVIPPPVDVGWFTPDPESRREDFYLLAGRMVPYKRPEVAVAAAVEAGAMLVVAGTGRSAPNLERIASAAPPGQIRFEGAVTRERLRHLMRTCRALVFPGEEDFGLVPVEAQACGTPVIALRKGGTLDTVVDGRTGTFFEPDGEEVAGLARVLRSFDAGRFDPRAIRAHAEGFSYDAFTARMALAVDGSDTARAR